jgi:hypothetical protein
MGSLQTPRARAVDVQHVSIDIHHLAGWQIAALVEFNGHRLED